MTPSFLRQVRGRVTVLEALALSLLVGLACIVGTLMVVMARTSPRADPLLAQLEARFGSGKHSQLHEEWLVRDFFNDRRNGTFLDVGANDYKKYSNTYFLETALGWSGVAIEPIAELAADYKRYRPKTTFVAMFASNVADSTTQLFVDARSHEVSSATPKFGERYGAKGSPRSVPTTTLNDVLDRLGVSKVDFLSMDIELAEPQALAGFDIDRFRPELVCIEGHDEVRQQILD